MRFNRKQGQFLADVISQWEADGTVNPETADTLKNSYAIRPFDWRRLAKYSFLIAVICAVVAVGALVADEYLLALIEEIFSAPDNVLCIFFAVLSAIAFYAGLRKRRSRPENAFGNEAVLFVGVLLAAASITFLGRFLDDGSGHFSILLLLAAVLYGVIGFCFSSDLVWAFSLLSLGGWFGAETGYISGWGAYFFGLNYPLRFALFGAALTAVGFVFKFIPRAAFLQGSTCTIGLLYLFAALWVLSIFGNYGDMHSWRRSTTFELLHWSLLFGLAALAAIWYGLKYDDATVRGFGLTFLFINLYTRYFEWFWNNTHKAAFFLILAVSFWLVGRKAEAIWNLEFVRGKDGREDG